MTCGYTYELGDGHGGVERKRCTLPVGHDLPHKMTRDSIRRDDRWEFRKAVAAYHGLDWPEQWLVMVWTNPRTGDVNRRGAAHLFGADRARSWCGQDPECLVLSPMEPTDHKCGSCLRQQEKERS